METEQTGIWDERSKTFIRPSGTVKQGRRPMFQAFAQSKGESAHGICPDCKGSGTRFEMRLNSCGHFPCPTCAPSGNNSPLTAPINWQTAAKEAARRYTETAAERDKLREQRDELLAALKEIEEDNPEEISDRDELIRCAGIARAAIAKAEGSGQS